MKFEQTTDLWSFNTGREELSSLGVLKLEDCSVLQDSYIRLRYKVIG